MSLTVERRTELDRRRFFIGGKCVDPRSDRTRFFIGGKRAAPRRARPQPAIEAATGALLGTAALGAEKDIDAAVAAARHALDHGPWGRTTAAERAAVMRRFADALEARGGD